jgi:archaellum component FlaF (FlaF/FlaG flagellin family)
MKKLLITLALFFTVLTSKAQEAFEGVWSVEQSTYKKVILASEHAVVKIINYSFKENATIKEVILSQTDITMTTSIYNPKNGYTVGMRYTILDDNTLQCVITGSIKVTILLKKIVFK